MYNENLPFLVFAVVAIIVVAALWYSYRKNQQRRDALFAMSNTLGMTFSIEDPFYIPDIYECCDWLSTGDSREASNVMAGQLGRFPCKAFDYKYCTGSGKSRETHMMSFVLVDTDVPFHTLTIRPEGFLDKLAGAIGFNDIDFESEEFSRRFYVGSADREFAYGVVHAKMMEYLLDNPQWSLQMVGRSVIVCNHRLFEPAELLQTMTFLRGFMDLIPDYLWQKLRESMETR